MNAKSVVALLLGLSVVGALVVTGIALGLSGLPIPGVNGGTDQSPEPPKLTSFQSSPVECSEDFMVNSSTTVRGGAANVGLTHERNISLPDPSYEINETSFERINETTYALRIGTDPTTNDTRECAAYTRYNASMQFPSNEEGWTVLLYHDGEQVGTFYGNSDSSGAGAGASVSAGQHVSDDESSG